MTLVSVILHYQGANPRDHRCLCSASIIVFLSLIFFLKTLACSLHNKDPKLCCMVRRNKLYVEFAPEGSEVISLAITPAFLTNNWGPREAWPSSVLLQQRAVIHCQWAQPWKAGQLPRTSKGKALSWQAHQSECQELDLEKQMTRWDHLKRESLKYLQRQCLHQQPSPQWDYSCE